MTCKITRIIAAIFFRGIFSMRLRRFEKLFQRIENYSKIIRYCSGLGVCFFFYLSCRFQLFGLSDRLERVDWISERIKCLSAYAVTSVSIRWCLPFFLFGSLYLE